MTGISHAADILRIEASGLPGDLPASTYEMIARGAALAPDAPALSFFLTTAEYHRPETWNYSELLADITRSANFFHDIGVRKDDVIAFVLPNLPETHFTIWGGQAAGIVTAINPLLEPAAIAQLLTAAEARVVVTLAPFPGTDLWQKVHAVAREVPTLTDLVLINLADRVRGPKKLAARAIQKREVFRQHARFNLRSTLPSHVRLHDFGSSIRRMNGDRLNSGRQISGEDYSSFFCTGGTTGLPKIAMRRHANEVANAWSAAQFIGDGVGPGKTLFCGLPLFHVNGVLVTGLMPFARGAHVVLGTPQGYRGEGVVARFWEIVEHHHINFFSGVPTLYSSLLQVSMDGHDVSSLEYGLCGAAPLPVEVMKSFEERTGLKILEGYGLTEGTCVSTVNPPLGERRTASIGMRIPGQHMKAVLLDEDGNYQRDCQIDEVGTLVISGLNVFAGYKVADQNRGLWVDTGDGQRWLNTGDLGRQDEDGYFYLTGRKKELIIRGGHNIDPQTIEEPLHRHPAVQVAAAIGRPDAHAGELPVAYVQLRDGVAVSEHELLDFCQQHINERAALPKYIRLIDEMPLTGVGKIFKPALKQLEARYAIEMALEEAGVGFAEVSVADDRSRGLVVAIRLAADASAALARQVLGQYPFPYTIA